MPVDAYRSALYTADELYGGLEDGYRATLDGRAYAWSQMPGVRPDAAVAQALHDAAVEEALDDLVAGRRVVGVMGGHAAERGTPAYREAAELGRALARDGALVATGGGPGAMEAVNLGAAMAGHADAALDEAIAALAAVPSFRPSVDRWAAVAMAVRARWPGDGGLGIPTWAYGARAAERVPRGDRQVLPERGPRGDAAAALRRRHRLPPRRRRHRPGALPGRL